jgi:hypothetical protein
MLVSIPGKARTVQLAILEVDLHHARATYVLVVKHHMM